MPEPVLLTQIESGVATLTLNRPDRRNALTRELIRALTEAFRSLDRDIATRVIILTGAGSSFCSGMDLDDVLAHGNSADAITDSRDLTTLFLQMQRQRQPVIAMLNGHAVAGGAGVMTACDIVFAADTVKVGYPEVLRGMVAAIVAPYLVRQVGDRRARRLLLTGELITAAEAERIGLINEVCPAAELAARVKAFVKSLLQAGPEAVFGTKRQLAAVQLDDDAAARAAEVSAAARLGEEARDGLAAFLEKRNPRWWPKHV